ncbi:uncharacterized protein N0V89_000550 [Didymosphaeria variabile]|uniref:HAUS augmin-like complex subunit 3 N-terminal domain-containing protein n=1 Tax=Didymosphaeria variabile TaxID=1932322 RepID=A0A9W9CFY7_9PLEO|nr:uncharacterized protein N0V89_000550 [Didymosphaeria variabile]KAJ4359991.1 hypothetical protein N0V89_000550 [Didymosphaeria variabile]
MAEEQAAHHLLNVLEERGLDAHLDLDNVLLAFEDDDIKREAAAWVEEYLHEDTLLTTEELELYQTLKKKGILHQYEAEEEPVRPFMDREVASAILSLQTSTAAIEEQCRVLETQKDALMKLKALDRPNWDVEHQRSEKRRKEHQEKARLDVTVNDVSTTISEQLADIQRDIDAVKSTLKSYLTERLASDDQILSRLPGIVSQIVTEPEVGEDEKSIEQWCKAIISYRTAEIKAKVDTVYLTSLTDYSFESLPTTSEEELEERKAALKAELEDLHTEIASVAEMVVDHELRKPMMDMRSRKERDTIQARSAWLNYVVTTLDYMAKRLDTVNDHTRNVDEFQQAFAHISQAAAKRMLDTSKDVSRPEIRRTKSGRNSIFSPALKLKPTKALDLPPALQDALRHASISFNQDSIEALQESLTKVQLERSKKLQDHYSCATTSTQAELADRLSIANADLRSIFGPLYKHTPFQQVNLMDTKLEKELEEMDRKLDDATEQLLSAETNELSLSDPKVRAFIAKYGR